MRRQWNEIVELLSILVVPTDANPAAGTSKEASTVWFNSADGGLYIGSINLSAGGGGGALTADVTAQVELGGVAAGEVLAAGSTLQDVVEQLLLTTLVPTFTAPSIVTTSDQSSKIEIGTTTDVLLTVDFDRGSIDGDLVGGVWDPDAIQDFRAGAVTGYTIGGTSTGLTNTRTVSGYTFVSGANSWTGVADYAEGPQPLDNSGANYSSPLAAGSISDAVTVEGVRRAFYGTSSAVGPTPPAASAEIRALSGSLLDPDNSSQFTINIAAGATMVVFAYPATLDDVSAVVYVEGFNADVKAIFDQTSFTVEGADGEAGVAYKVYTYIPVEAFPDSATYEVQI